MPSEFLRRVRRGEGKFYGPLKRFVVALLHFNLTPPDFLKGFLRVVYDIHYAVPHLFRVVINIFYRGPLFKARCERVGRNLHLWYMPHVNGPVKIYVGDDVKIFGHVGIESSSRYDARLVIGDGVNLGHRVGFTVNKEVVLEERCNIASGVNIVDTDAHPRNTEDRIKGLPPPPDEVKPVRICKWAWLGAGCMIMKGVTVGEGAVVGAGSIVVTDVPPYSIVMGNPARVVVKDVRIAQSAPVPAQPAS